MPSYSMKRFIKKEVIPIRDVEIVALFFQRDEQGISAARENYGRLLKSLAFGILRS